MFLPVHPHFLLYPTSKSLSDIFRNIMLGRICRKPVFLRLSSNFNGPGLGDFIQGDVEEKTWSEYKVRLLAFIFNLAQYFKIIMSSAKLEK